MLHAPALTAQGQCFCENVNEGVCSGLGGAPKTAEGHNVTDVGQFSLMVHLSINVRCQLSKAALTHTAAVCLTGGQQRNEGVCNVRQRVVDSAASVLFSLVFKVLSPLFCNSIHVVCVVATVQLL